MKRVPSILVIVLLAAAAARTEDWPQWRGAKADGVSSETGWRAEWTDAKPKVLWTKSIDRGYSSFAISTGKLYTMGSGRRRPQTETVYCLDANSGKELWKHTYELRIRRAGTPVSPTPAVVGKFVYTYGAAADLFCFEAATGRVVWKRHLAEDPGAAAVAYGYTASPVVTDGVVIVPVFLNLPERLRGRPKDTEPRGGAYPKTGGMLLAFDVNSGKEKWRQTVGASGWSTPAVGKIDGKKTVVHHTGTFLFGVSPADGKLLWKYEPKRLRRVPAHPYAVASTPVVVGDSVIFPSKYAKGTLRVRIKDGKAELLWRGPLHNWYHSAVIYDGRVYIPHGDDRVGCLDVESGEWKYDLGKTGKLPTSKTWSSGRGGMHGGGFMIADGKILLIDAKGDLVIHDVSNAIPKLLSRIKALGPDRGGYKYETAPVLANGRVYCRKTDGQIVCLDLRK